MSTMGLHLQAHTNVRDVLAPLFSNGRSFASLIDELSRHFKLEETSKSYGAYGDDPTGVLEASSESQSTDSEAEGNMSDETDSRRVQARVSAQARSADAAAAMTAGGVAAAAAVHGTPSAPSLKRPPPVVPSTCPPLAATAGVSAPAQDREGLRRTRSRSRQQQQQQQTEALRAAVGEAGAPMTTKERKAKATREGGGVAAGGGASVGGGAGGSGGRGGTRLLSTDSGGGIGGSGDGAESVVTSTKGFFSGDDLTVLSVTANADGWSEAVGAALSTRARAGYAFAQEVDPDSPQSTEFVREVFVDERSGAQKALELRLRLIPVSQKVLLCSAWVDSGEYLAAAARLVAQCQAEIFGIACVRFEQNQSTEGLLDRFNLFAKSMPKGSVPSLNMGMKNCIPASLTKGVHGYTYDRGGVRSSGAMPAAGRSAHTLEGSSTAGVDDGGSGSGGGATRAVAIVKLHTGDEARPNRANKRRRSGSEAGGVPPPSQDAGEVAGTASCASGTAVLEPMDEDSVVPAAEDVSAGEGLTEPGSGGQPAQRERFGGGATSESEKAARASDGGDGAGWRRLVGSATFGEEDGDYAADSERSTDHESMHVYGVGGVGGRERDERDASMANNTRREAAAPRSGRGCGGRGAAAGGRRGRGRSSSSGGRTKAPGRGGEFRASSPETGAEADGETSFGRISAPTSDGRGAGRGSRASSQTSSASQRRRRFGAGIGVGGGPLLDEAGEHSRPSANSEASGNGGGEEETEGLEEDVKDTGMQASGGAVGDGSVGVEAVAPLEWKSKLGRPPIFMSRGLPEKNPSLLLSNSEGGIHATRSPGRSDLEASSVLSQDPEDDRDRASSFSSADSPIRRGRIVRRCSRANDGTGEVFVAAPVAGHEGTGLRSNIFAAAAGGNASWRLPAANSSAPSPPPTKSELAAAPNSPGGAAPWHHTSVYEANNPTEDRHAELSHDALGIKVYCVCDGHGGSRAAQFVCDHLAANVLERVVSMDSAAAAAAAPAAATEAAQPPAAAALAQKRDRGGGSGAGVAGSGGIAGDIGDGGGGLWTGNYSEIRQSLTEAFESCDEQFIAQLDPTKNRGYINAGCCVVLALLIRSKLYVAHVGDCRVVLGTRDAARFSPGGALPSATSSGTGAAAGVAGIRGGAVGSGERIRGGGSCRDVGGASGVAAPRGQVISPSRAAAVAATAAELSAVQLSRDHNCEDADEAALVRARSGDDNAIRVSRNDVWRGARAIKRVAGSLAVTRAIGDAYLKKAAFSFSPYKEGVPYITAQPAVTVLELTSADRFLVLATDGVWEQVSNEEAVRCVAGALGSRSGRRQRLTASRTAAGVAGGGGSGSGSSGSDGFVRAGGSYTSDALVDLVLARSAQSHGMSVPALRALPRGQSRRMLHDDVCVTVVHFAPAPRPPVSL